MLFLKKSSVENGQINKCIFYLSLKSAHLLLFANIFYHYKHSQLCYNWTS